MVREPLPLAVPPVCQVFQREEVDIGSDAVDVAISHHEVTNAGVPTAELAVVGLVLIGSNRRKLADRYAGSIRGRARTPTGRFAVVGIENTVVIAGGLLIAAAYVFFSSKECFGSAVCNILQPES